MSKKFIYLPEPEPVTVIDPEWDAPEWDSADSDAHQARVEAGKITQDGEPRQPGTDEWGHRQPEAGG